MRRMLALALASVAGAAASSCTDLRVEALDTGADASDSDVAAPPAEDGDAAPAQEGGPSRSGGDAGEADDAAPSCDGPCPPEPLATGLVQATAIAVDGNNVYFAVESGIGAVFQCPKTGCNGAPIKLGTGYATAIALDAQRVYWGDFSAGKLVSCTIGGCSETPTTEAPNQAHIRGVSTDGVDLFWSTSASGGSIMWCTRGACAPGVVKAGQGTVLDLAADQGLALWGSVATGAVNACAPGSCVTPTVLGPGATDVSVHAGTAYWVNAPAKTVVACATTGCGGSPTTLGSSTAPSHPVSDGVHVYWRDALLDQIYRCPAAGCAPGPEILATKQRGQPGGQIALDRDHVYWTTASGVYRLRK